MRSLNAYEEVKLKITEDVVRGRFLMGKALPAEKVLSNTFPLVNDLNFVLTNAGPFPGFTCKNSIIL